MPVALYSVGHSNHSAEVFIDLLRRCGIEAVVDVRSHPYSRFARHFSRGVLDRLLREAGVSYVYLGQELGGRPEGDEFYDEDEHVRYDRVAQTESFRAGLGRLLDGAARMQVAIMCSEEDPLHCHRRLLVTRVLESEGLATVAHVRGDGTIQSEASLSSQEEQLALFGAGGGERMWRSTRSVSRRRAPSGSSVS